jgi:hypothetical protein
MPEQQDQTAEKRIIIDENYKAQVESEKAAAAKSERTPESRQRIPLPPASFAVLVASLATQALMALGLVPNPSTQKSEPDFDQAKHLIDMLGVLEEKTRGNLTPDEKRYIESVLFDLRLQYVEASAKRVSS